MSKTPDPSSQDSDKSEVPQIKSLGARLFPSVHAFINPTITVIGQEMASTVQSYIDGLKSRREEKVLREQVSQVQARMESDGRLCMMSSGTFYQDS